MQFWRSPTGQEADFVINKKIAIVVKSSQNVSERHFEGLLALNKVNRLKIKTIVCREPYPKVIQGVEILPMQNFAELLWTGEIF